MHLVSLYVYTAHTCCGRHLIIYGCACVRACVRACVHAWLGAWLRGCVRACVLSCVSACAYARILSSSLYVHNPILEHCRCLVAIYIYNVHSK